MSAPVFWRLASSEELLVRGTNDFEAHVRRAEAITLSPFFMSVPHPGWHITFLGVETVVGRQLGIVLIGSIAMGVLVMLLNVISNVWIAAPFLVLLGALGGFLVVPMNALLQHRGHNLMGAGRSIAVQNFNEQTCILVLGGLYSLSTGMGVSAFVAITAFGVLVAGCMWLIKRWHERNCREHGEEVEHLLGIARNDNLHG
jgi:hypothetical protein